MKMIIMSSVAAILIAYGASFVLFSEQDPAYQVYVGSGTRLGDPGYNLVGPEWTGNPKLEAPSS